MDFPRAKPDLRRGPHLPELTEHRARFPSPSHVRGQPRGGTSLPAASGPYERRNTKVVNMTSFIIGLAGGASLAMYVESSGARLAPSLICFLLGYATSFMISLAGLALQ